MLYLQLAITSILLLAPFLAAAAPAVLLPGDGASALEIRYQDMSPPHFWCSKSSHGWERLWIPNLSELLPKNIDCWSQRIKLHYNGTRVSNAPGVLGVRSIEGPKGLQIMANKPSAYQALLDALPDLQVATYDFRLSPRGNPAFMKQLKAMVEQASTPRNKTTKDDNTVTLICHSLGCLIAHYFLTSFVTEEWKQQYIRAWIALAPAYGGTKITLKQLISGDAENIPWLNGKDVREEQRSYENSVWLLPNPRLYHDSDVLVSSPIKNYTVHNYLELFQDAQFDNFSLQWDRVKNLTMWDEEKVALQDPNVAVYPIYGTDVETVERYVYQSTSLTDEPSQINSPRGDGTVNLQSLTAGNRWTCAHPPLQRPNVSHVEVLSDPQALQHVKAIVEGSPRFSRLAWGF